MARERYLVGVSEEELRPDPKPEGPKTFKGKWDNYWYHHKWTTIIVITLVAIFTFMIVQVLTVNTPDYSIVLATSSNAPDTATSRLTLELQKYGRDIDGDGKVEIQLEALNIGDKTQYGMLNKQKLMAHLAATDVMFFIFDKDAYENITGQGNLPADYEFYSPLDFQANGIEEGRYWNWKEDPIRGDSDFADLPENIYFGVRDLSEISVNKKVQKAYDDNMKLLKAFITKTPPETPAS